MLSVTLILAIFTHLPSFCLLIKDFKKGNVRNVILIYRSIFIMDLILIFLYLPSDIYWSVTRQSQYICKFMKFSGFTFFFGVCIFLIVLSVDRFFDKYNYYLMASLFQIHCNLLPFETLYKELSALVESSYLDGLDLLLQYGTLAGPCSPCWTLC